MLISKQPKKHITKLKYGIDIAFPFSNIFSKLNNKIKTKNQ